ncbi:hypothetical protein RRG08_060085 [Elysia crispata]|uniref:Uncharacterized protein n=1 Tax=Elysia crispata TaxID=231223 RepID=A0AAE1D913_9GAST|nr:hypothetical protein RRG08_060085 [Elysia crispata]
MCFIFCDIIQYFFIPPLPFNCTLQPDVSYVEELDYCLIHGTYRLCGEDWGTFVADVWRIFSRDEMSEYGCTNRHIRL